MGLKRSRGRPRKPKHVSKPKMLKKAMFLTGTSESDDHPNTRYPSTHSSMHESSEYQDQSTQQRFPTWLSSASPSPPPVPVQESREEIGGKYQECLSL